MSGDEDPRSRGRHVRTKRRGQQQHPPSAADDSAKRSRAAHVVQAAPPPPPPPGPPRVAILAHPAAAVPASYSYPAATAAAMAIVEPMSARECLAPGLGLTCEEHRYLASQPAARRETLVAGMRLARRAHVVPLRFRVLESNLPNKAEILARLASGEAGGKYENWVNAALQLPIGLYSSPPAKALRDIGGWLAEARARMDRALHGQEAAKDECIRMLCLWASSGERGRSSWAIGLHGMPGIGKTSFAQNILASVMQRPFTSISLAGVGDSSYLLGHSYTYEGATCGRIADAMRAWGVSDGILYFDELDKTSKARGDDLSSMLVNLTDREQNMRFRDKYFSSIDLDLGRSIMVFSYNDSAAVNPVLLERLNVIHFQPPGVEDKLVIAREHLLPRALRRAGLRTGDVRVDDAALHALLGRCPTEHGVRGLDKAIGRMVNTLLVALHHSGEHLKEVRVGSLPLALPVCLTPAMVAQLVPTPTPAEHAPPSLMYT